MPRGFAKRRRNLHRLILAGLILFSGLVLGALYFQQWSAKNGQGSPQVAAGATPGSVSLPALPPPDLFRPLSPEEAQQANANRPVEALPTAPAKPFRLSGDEISRLRAIDCLTQAVYYEAASEGVDGGRAVAQVVLNRVRHPGYPNSVCGVVYQGSERATGCQFTFTCDGALARRPVGYLWARSRLIASEALAGRSFAPVGYSTHYHADYVVPYWAASLDKVAVIGRHIFYRLRGGSGSGRAFAQGYAGREPEPAVPPTSTEVIEASLDTLENATKASETLEEPKVEEDRIEALAPSDKPATADSAKLEADLARGQLILGEAAPTPAPKTRSAPEGGCTSNGVQRIQAVGSAVNRVGAEKAGC